ncbi:adenylate/guanylate cyclase domain-containing protein [Amycolatopsis albispora]|uniref:adenylate/guanylate cyclase domain-containing protein n=1 Tax=Amycolatopsis albispora TaxID=1804986 RepID=UPI00196695A1|nr:adenylate/guanylate cyclase domain-containing protein [Amycolatopsis albispora]
MSGLDPGPPVTRVIFAVDIEGSTKQNNMMKAGLRAAMYKMVEQSLRQAGIGENHHEPWVDRGDSVLVLVRPVDEVPRTVFLSEVVPSLEEMLQAHAAAESGHRLRMRAVLHAGEVHIDRYGCFGEALDIAFRLLDAPMLKDLFRSTETPLLLAVSDAIYQGVVRQGYDGIDPASFTQALQVEVANQLHRGWVRTKEGAPPQRHGGEGKVIDVNRRRLSRAVALAKRMQSA